MASPHVEHKIKDLPQTNKEHVICVTTTHITKAIYAKLDTLNS